MAVTKTDHQTAKFNSPLKLIFWLCGRFSVCSIAYILTSCGMGREVWQRLVLQLLLYIHVHVGNGNKDQLSVDEVADQKNVEESEQTSKDELTAHAVNQNIDEQG